MNSPKPDGYAVVQDDMFVGIWRDPDIAGCMSRRGGKITPMFFAPPSARWIPVGEKLPTHEYTVVIRVEDDGLNLGDYPYVDTGIYNTKRGKWQMNFGDDDIDVSAWFDPAVLA